MQYEVRALRGNEVATLLVDAANEADAMRRAAAPTVRPLNARPARRPLNPGDGGKGGFSLLLFSQELLALLEAGLTPVEAVDALIEKERSIETRGILSTLASALNEGKTLSGAMQVAGDVFPPLFVGLIKSAERTSNLVEALERYIEYRTRADILRARLGSSLIYPALLAVVGLAVTLFLVGYVVPRFAGVYRGSGRSLPWLSSLLMQWGEFAAAHARPIGAAALALLLAGAFAGRHLLRTQALSRLLRRLPGVAERVFLYELSRMYMTIGMLLQGGLPLLAAMEMVQDVLSPEMRRRTREAMQSVAGGESASRALEAAGLTTSIGLRLLRVGEKSGRLGEMMTRAARFYDGQIERWVEWFVRLFEPILMTAIGLVVGLVVVLLYMPIFDLAGSLQ